MAEASVGPGNQASPGVDPPSSQNTGHIGQNFEQPQALAESIETDIKQNEEESQVTEDQWKAMFELVLSIYEYREPDGHDPSRLFHRSVNKRNVPDYYDVIKEPMALSILKQKIRNRSYKTFAEFVRDCALIPHNAQTYNRPRSQAYEDALIIKDVFASEFKKLADQEIISAETAELPDLGEIPEADPLPIEEEDDDEEEEDDDEEAEDSDEEGGRRRRKRFRRGSQSSKRGGNKDEFRKSIDPATRKKRGRPPRVDTPMEARIKAVLKGIRKPRDQGGLKIRHFEKLPDKALYPDYYTEIREPMAVDLIKRKSKRKKYASVDHFMRDIDLMFNNAKTYNQPDSQLYQDADDLQAEAHRLAEQEKNKPDSEYLMEDGRLPLPNGISYKDEIWRVGDWVHIQNPNDANKPIVAQIYRTWQDSDGQKWVNACWYYRPEQTVHHVDKHFLPNEVMKTGQYRDHRIDEVEDRCFVMFFTRYNRGRPRGFPPEKQVYVCEARYNEEKHKLNKIKTWASCLPDEVREKDYEMDLFDGPRKIRKVPSPIKHLLPTDAKETDDLPKPTWGAENAPPIIGAVHCRPRDENESPPPEPTPPPPPQPTSQSQPSLPPRPMSANQPAPQTNLDARRDSRLSAANFAPVPTPSPVQPPHLQPAAQVPLMPSIAQQPFQVPSLASSQYQPSQPIQAPHVPIGYATYPQPTQQPFAMSHNYPTQMPSRVPQPSMAMPHTHTPNPNAARSSEFITLPEEINNAIPPEVRAQFQCDDKGRVLFWSTPPIDVVNDQPQPLSHTPEYLAARARRQTVIDRVRRKILDEQKRHAEDDEQHRFNEEEKEAVKEENLKVKMEYTKPSTPLRTFSRETQGECHGRELEIARAYIAGRTTDKEDTNAKILNIVRRDKGDMFDPKTLSPRRKYFPVKDHWTYLTESSKKGALGT
ncbi:hypothetical protein D8B26_001199 [Coccidioides posadasii str. Silveira]|uniref:uncharacterized protein n=1 Tax=Coccidioides posadasii (strain RMSCC 757 / Silveira) TaxID=443226 RepID=UPI001BF0D948|nr:hypothetical protein D8B26_001199 [Coccidioides posadasii str. Silveira]